MKKSAQRDANTARWLSKAGPKNFAPSQTPFPGDRDGQNLNSWRWSLPSPTDPVWWKSMHAIWSYRGNRPTDTQTHTHKQTNPQTGPITIHCAVKCNWYSSFFFNRSVFCRSPGIWWDTPQGHPKHRFGSCRREIFI